MNPKPCVTKTLIMSMRGIIAVPDFCRFIGLLLIGDLIVVRLVIPEVVEVVAGMVVVVVVAAVMISVSVVEVVAVVIAAMCNVDN